MTTRRGWADDVFRAGVLPQQSSPVTSGKQDLPQSTGTYGRPQLTRVGGASQSALEKPLSLNSNTPKRQGSNTVKESCFKLCEHKPASASGLWGNEMPPSTPTTALTAQVNRQTVSQVPVHLPTC